MDVVGDAVATVRTGEPHGSRSVQVEHWKMWFPPSTSAGFHAVLAGRCWLHTSTGPPVELQAGDVVFLPQGRGHGLASEPTTPLADAPPWRAELHFAGSASARAPASGTGDTAGFGGSAELLCGAYGFSRRSAHPLLDDLPAVVHLRADQDAALRAVVGLLADEMEAQRPGARTAATSLLDVALVHLVRLALDLGGRRRVERPGGWAHALADPVVGVALAAIHEDISAAWTVESLGRLGGASRTAFSERFTRLTGQPPLRYLTWWRMTCAARLLDEADTDAELTLARVARQVGYRSEHAFGKAFKRHHGLAPGRYRRARSVDA